MMKSKFKRSVAQLSAKTFSKHWPNNKEVYESNEGKKYEQK